MFDVDESLGGGDGVDSTQIVTDNDLKATRYAIECALDGEQSITETINGTPVEFEGALGLAPQWYGSSCDTDCQQWVSACLLARTNLTGVAGADVELWIDDPTSDEDPDPDYTFEAGFFGNLFTSTGGYLCQDVGGVVGSVTAARVCSATTGCLVPLTNRYLSCNGGLLPRCDDEPGTPHHHDCQAGLVPSGTKFNTLNIYVEPNAVEVLAGALGL